MNQQQFIKTGQGKNIPAKILKFIWDNKEAILALLVALFGKDKIKAMVEEPPKPNCDKNDPGDSHYGEAGDYNNQTDCVWIPEI